MHFIWLIFFNSGCTRYLFLLMCVICAKGKEAVANSGYTNFCFMINDPLKMLPFHFRYFQCSNFKITFDKNIYEKSYHCLTSSKFLLLSLKILFSGNRWQKIVVPWMITKICKKIFCLLSMSKLKAYEIFNFWIFWNTH